MRETWVRSLGWEDPLEEGMAPHSNILAWKIHMDRGAWLATGHRVTQSWTQLCIFMKQEAVSCQNMENNNTVKSNPKASKSNPICEIQILNIDTT